MKEKCVKNWLTYQIFYFIIIFPTFRFDKDNGKSLIFFQALLKNLVSRFYYEIDILYLLLVYIKLIKGGGNLSEK